MENIKYVVTALVACNFISLFIWIPFLGRQIKRLNRHVDQINETVNTLSKAKPFGRDVRLTKRDFVRIGPFALLDIDYPKGHEVTMELLPNEVLDEISNYTIANALMVLQSDKEEKKKEIRRRYMTALAALYELEIPRTLALLDAGARQVYERILRTMEAFPVEIQTNFDDWNYLGHEMDKEYYTLSKPENHATMLSGRIRYYHRFYLPVEKHVIQTLLQQSSGMIYPFWPAFEKKLRKNLGVNFIFIDANMLKSIVTAVAYKHKLNLPKSYVRQAPLTALLATTVVDETPKSLLFQLREIK